MSFKNFVVEPATITWHSWSQDDHNDDLRPNKFSIYADAETSATAVCQSLVELKLQWLNQPVSYIASPLYSA